MNEDRLCSPFSDAHYKAIEHGLSEATAAVRELCPATLSNTPFLGRVQALQPLLRVITDISRVLLITRASPLSESEDE